MFVLSVHRIVLAYKLCYTINHQILVCHPVPLVLLGSVVSILQAKSFGAFYLVLFHS